MINVENDPSVPGATPARGGERLQMNTLRPEEVKMYKDCVWSMYYKAGIPFAMFCHFVSSRLKSEAELLPRNYLKKGFLFLGNVILGSLLFSPTCFYKLMAMREAADKKAREMGLESPSVVTEEVHTGPQQAEDFTYPADLMTNLNEPEGNFSSDFNSSSGLLVDDFKDDKDLKVRSTTYEELRARHRNRYANTTPAPPSSLNLSEPISSTPPSPTDRTKPLEELSSPSRPRKVVKNKYGDEIE